MPHTNTITPPGFNDFRDGGDTFAEIAPTPVTQADIAQSVVFSGPWTALFTISLVISLILAIIAVYSMIRIWQIRKMEKEHYRQKPLSKVAQRVFGGEGASHGSANQHRWRDVLQHVSADNINDWRQAILEADVMLDDAITKRGYVGEGLGEKMKQIARSDINTIDDAWEAHKMRNRIAHEGSNLELTQREARRIIGLYERVFRELGYITE